MAKLSRRFNLNLSEQELLLVARAVSEGVNSLYNDDNITSEQHDVLVGIANLLDEEK